MCWVSSAHACSGCSARWGGSRTGGTSTTRNAFSVLVIVICVCSCREGGAQALSGSVVASKDVSGTDERAGTGGSSDIVRRAEQRVVVVADAGSAIVRAGDVHTFGDIAGAGVVQSIERGMVTLSLVSRGTSCTGIDSLMVADSSGADVCGEGRLSTASADSCSKVCSVICVEPFRVRMLAPDSDGVDSPARSATSNASDENGACCQLVANRTVCSSAVGISSGVKVGGSCSCDGMTGLAADDDSALVCSLGDATGDGNGGALQ